MLGFGVGATLILIGFTAQWLLKKRLQNAKFRQFYMWVAWSMALLGSAVVSPTVGNSIGITSVGAAVVSVLMLLALGVDFADKRPDWPAFFIIVLVPWFMQYTGGKLGQFFDVILLPLNQLGQLVLAILGA